MSNRARPRLEWLDLLRLLAILQILGFHWLRTCFETGRYGLTWSPAYQNVGIGFGQLQYLLVDHTGLSAGALANNAIGLAFGFGWEAVNVFVLVSGLGLALHYRPDSSGFSIWSWYGHRFRRILVPFYSVAFPMLLAGALFKLAASGGSGVLASLAAKIAGKNLAEPLPVEFLTHLFLFDPRQAHWAVNFFAPAWWFIPPLLVAYLCFPLFWRLIERLGAPLVLAASLALTVTAYWLASSGAIVWNGWYYIVFLEAFNFSLGIVAGGMLQEESSFLKKSSKKLLSVASDVSFDQQPRVLPARSKSFLVLFFKKEHFLLAFGLPLFALGNLANWFTPLYPISSVLLTPGFTLVLAFCAVRLARVPGAMALCRAIDPYYLYLLHQPFVLPVALTAAALAGPAARAAGFSIGFAVYIVIALAAVIGVRRLSAAVTTAWADASGGFTRRVRREARS